MKNYVKPEVELINLVAEAITMSLGDVENPFDS